MKYWPILIVVSAVFLLLTPLTKASFDVAQCFDYYKFENGLSFDNFHTVKGTYYPDEQVAGSFDLRSNMTSPIVDGRVKIQILYEDGNQQYIVDELFPSKDINLFYGDVMPQEFRWIVPSDAKPGDYVVKSYFIVADKFNLAGVNFVPSIPGAETRFKITNANYYSYMHFDQANTNLNGVAYSFVGFTSSIDAGSAADIKTKIINDGIDAKSGTVFVNTYRWDDVKEDQLIDSKTFPFNVDAGKSQDLEYSTAALSTDAYLVVFTAKSSSGQTLSIMKIRVSVSGAKGRFMYLGFDRFPLLDNEPAKIFFCASNGADYMSVFNGTGYVDVVDNSEGGNGRVIFRDTFSPYDFIPTPPDGMVTSFTPSKNYFNLTLRGYMYDQNGNLVDFSRVAYDYSKFDSINVSFRISAADYASPGSELAYSISLQDSYGNPLSTDMIVYLLDADEKIVSSNSYSGQKSVQGSFSLSSDIPEGTYTIRALDTAHNIKTDKAVAVSKFAISPQILTIIIAVIAIAILALIFAKLTKKI